MYSVELFGGAGGLALGCELAGFHPLAFVERDRWACDTVRRNQVAGFPLVQDWNVLQGDVRDVDLSRFASTVDVLTAGPPCQPFSLGGKARAADDSRDMFPATVEAIRVLQPRAFIVENVKGLTRATFKQYLRLIMLRLEFPEVAPSADESWETHLDRLEGHAQSQCHTGLRYSVSRMVLNAANFGVPQKRERVFFVGFRSDIEPQWSFPPATHSAEALWFQQFVTGEYWDRHKIRRGLRPEVPGPKRRLVDRLRGMDQPPLTLPWVTVRDALAGLPQPELRGSRKFKNHVLQEGARSYPGHTGSPMDLPAKTLKAGDHGVPGGENMLRELDDSIRYFTIRESARLQTFPDEYELHGSWTEAMRQLGNAVPVQLAHVVAQRVKQHLQIHSSAESLQAIA